jgi:Predicted transcriptional regulators
MRMAELARQSGLSVPTIKYYLREGLLQPGRRTSVNQAVYDASHLERLRLIRALSTVAGLPLTRIREVVRAVSAESSVLEAMAVTQDALVGDAEATSPDERATQLLSDVIAARGWRCQPGSPAYVAAERAVAELHAEDLTMLLDRLDDYSRAADDVGRIDVQAVAGVDGLDAMIRGVVLGSVLRRPLLDALVLLAQQHHANELQTALTRDVIEPSA